MDIELRALTFCAIILWLVWRLNKISRHSFALMKRKNTVVIEYPNELGRWISGIHYLWAGPRIALKSYVRTNEAERGTLVDVSQVSGTPYAVRTPENYYVHLSSQLHIREIIEAPENELSLHAVSKDMFMPQYTMNGLEVDDSMRNNGTLHHLVLRGMLSSQLHLLRPSLHEAVCNSVTRFFETATTSAEDWTELQNFSLAKNIIVAANGRAFFGEQLSSNPEFRNAALDYPEDLFRTAEVLRLLPKAFAPIIAPILMRQHRASKIMVKFLKPVVEQRLKRSQSTTESSETKPVDCIQFFVDANCKKGVWTTDKLIQVLLGIWFAALHQPALSLTYVLEDLCAQPHYIGLLRKELRACDTQGEATQRLPLLDSLLKESARFHPSDSISVRRKVLKPFKFSDGTPLFPGDVACVPLQAIMQDSSNYPNSAQFIVDRFVDRKANGSISRFTDTSPAYPLWGLGKHGCPGRFLAADVLKVALAHILLTYDIKISTGTRRGDTAYTSTGHALSFFQDGERLLTNAGLYFHQSQDPFGLTIAGQLLYVVTSPQDVTDVYKNTKTLTFYEYVQDVMRSVGVSEDGIRKSWRTSVQPDMPHRVRKSLAEAGADYYREQLLPGKRLDALWPRVLRSIDALISWEHLKQLNTVKDTQKLDSISLMHWTQDVLLTAVTTAFLGEQILKLEPQLLNNFIAFDQESWKLIYKFPRPISKHMYSAKDRMIKSVETYLQLPREQRLGQAWLIDKYEAETEDLKINNHDLAAMIMSLLWVILSNAYKLCFWMLAQLLFDPALYEAMEKECDQAMSSDLSGLETRLEECPHLMALYQEVLRLTTNSTAIRTVESITPLGRYTLRPGAKVLLPFRQMHFDEKVFGENPRAFDPARFLKDPSLSKSPSFRPFGGGSTYCPGRYVARYEVLTFIALAMTRFDLRLAGRERAIFPKLDTKIPTLGMMMPVAGQDVWVCAKQRKSIK